MSIASELNRLLQAKSDLATSITNKGVTVPAATTIDGYAALVDQIQQGSVLPYDAEVEYLQSSGTQYINTGVIINNTFTFYSKVAVLDLSSQTIYWGARNSGRYNSRSQQCYLNNNPATTATKPIHLWTDSTGTEYQENSWNSGITPVVNTMYELSAMTCYSGLGQFTYPIYLFAINDVGTTKFYNTCRIGLWIAYRGCTKVAEMIPVRVGQVGYMYDKVSGELFGNDGTGNFTLGPDIT